MHLMRPARMTAQNASWVWDVIYSPFGAVSYIWTNPATQNLRFPGQWFQLETGLAYNWHRHYDATLGRYVQPDPIGFEGGRNLYGYVGQSPMGYVDTDGLNPIVLGAGACLASPACAAALAGLGTWAIAQAWKRPDTMTRLEQRAFDRNCDKEGDPCKVLQAEADRAIEAAKGKQTHMLIDPKGLYGTSKWVTHGNDLSGRINGIKALISLGQKMGCDMSKQISDSAELSVPTEPIR